MARRRRDLEIQRVEFPSEVKGGHEEFLVKFIRKLSFYYLKTDRRTGTVLAFLPGQIVKWPFNQAYPAAMDPLIEELGRLTDLIPVNPLGAILTGDEHEQWRSDRNAWMARLARYREIHEQAMAEAPLGPPLDIPIEREPITQQYLDEVSLPLLLGFFPGSDVQQPLDAVTPITLKYQVEILDEAYTENLSRFVNELKDRAIAAAEAAVGITGVVLLALGVYGAVEFVKAFRGSK